MGILERMERRTSLENPSVSLANPPAWLLDSFGAQPTSSGVYVSEQSALRYSTVWLCQKILSETIGMLPLKVHERLERGRRPRPDHWLSRLLAEPHPDLTTMQFLELLEAYLAIWGNSYWEIEWAGGGLEAVALHPLLPNMTRAKRRETGAREKYYITKIKENGTWREVELPAHRVLHVAGQGYDGLMGYSPISYARQAIGLGLAAEQFGAMFYPNGNHIGLAITHPQTLSIPARENLRMSLEMMNQGLSQAHRAAVFEEGVKVEKLGVNPVDAQFIELRKFQVVDTARCFRMPLHKVLDYDHANFSNTEEMNIDFATDTIAPPTVRIQQAIGRALLSKRERATLYCEFNLAGLLRGNLAARAAANATAVQNGWRTRNQVREDDNENPIPAEDGGDEYTVQLNMIPLRLLGVSVEGGSPPADPSPVDTPASKSAASALREHRMRLLLDRVERSYLPLLEAEARRIVTREAGAVRKAITKPEPDLRAWGRDFFGREAAHVSQVIGPAVRSLADALVSHSAELLLPGDVERAATLAARAEELLPAEILDLGVRASAGALAMLEAAITGEPGAAAAALGRMLEEWERSRPAAMAREICRAARKLGANLVCDSLGLADLGRELAKEEVC